MEKNIARQNADALAAQNKGRALNPETEVICDEAIKSAFARAQEIAVLAQISAQTGIGMEM